MGLLNVNRNVLASCVTVALLAGCGVAQPPIGSPGTTEQKMQVSAQRLLAKSWIARGAAKGDLLYVSTFDTVYVFSYPNGTLVGTLTGFDVPMGLCSDSRGDVWVTNASTVSGQGYLVEYAHGGTSPIATLNDTYESPVACSVDPTTGNLAAANDCPEGDCASTVAIYASAQGEPTQISTNPLWGPFQITYDNASNIFVAAEINFYDHQTGWLPSGQSQFQIFKMEPKTLSSHNVAWDGKYLAVAKSQDHVHRYQLVDGHGQAVPPAVQLNGCCRHSQMLIRGSTLISPSGNSTVSFWAYPAGGSATKVISIPSQPHGVAISVARH